LYLGERLVFQACHELAPETKTKSVAALGSISMAKAMQCNPASISGSRFKLGLNRLKLGSWPSCAPQPSDKTATQIV